MHTRLRQLIIIFTLSLTATMTSSNLTIQPGSEFNDWWQYAVFYQIYPRSFMDSNGDGVGDLKGITSKLNYLADTGIRATWLSPIFKSPMVDFGYDISDYTAIQPEYGTMADFEELVATAYSVGIKIVLDFVPNHTSDEHEWFKKSAAREAGYEDFYVWSDEKLNANGERVPPNNWQSVFYGSAWTWHEGRKQYYLHQFTKQQPDLNFRNPNVVTAMDKVLNFWLDKGVAGFRIDAVNHLFEDPALPDEPLSGRTTDSKSYDYTNHVYTKNLPEVLDMLQHWRRLLEDYTAKHDGPTRIMMTEAYADLKVLMDYYETEKGVPGSQIPFNFNFITDVNATSDARDYVYNIEKWLIYMPRGHAANWVMGNHDNARVASRFGTDCVDAMNMLLMTLPGVAVTYNGEELGMEDYRDISWADTVDPPARNAGEAKYKKVSRDPERTPFQWNEELNAGFSTAAKTWLPVNPNYKTLNLAKQAAAERSHYKVYKALLELRKTPVLRRGRFTIEALSRAVFAFKRELKSHDTLITIINVSAEPQEVDLTEFIDAKTKISVEIAGVDSSYEPGQQLQALHKTAKAITTTTTSLATMSTTNSFKMAPREALVLKCFTMLTADRRAFIKTLIKSANILLVGLLMYKLWQGKWTKVNLYNQF